MMRYGVPELYRGPTGIPTALGNAVVGVGGMGSVGVGVGVGSVVGEWYQQRSITENQQMTMQSVTSLTFDPYEELLWTGLSNGKVVSYLNGGSASLEKYTAFPVSQESQVIQILVDEEGIITLNETSLRYHKKGGFPRATFSEELQEFELDCMAFASGGNQRDDLILLGGATHSLLVFDMQAGRLQREVSLSQGLVNIRRSQRLVCCAGANGEVTFHDPRSYRIEHTFLTHNGGIVDMDVKNDILVTCGYSKRGQQLYLDPIVKVYDLRTMRPLAPIPFPAGPHLLRFHPKFSSTLAIASETGQFQLTDAQGELGPLRYYQVECVDIITALDIASTGETMAFGDAGGFFHQWVDRDDVKINIYSHPTEIVDVLPPPPSVRLDDDSSLSLVPIPPIENRPLLSDWPLDLNFEVGKMPTVLPIEFLQNLRADKYGGIATRNTPGAPPLRNRRNIVAHLSPSASAISRTTDDGPIENQLSDSLALGEKKVHYTNTTIPKRFRKTILRALEDFSQYNKLKMLAGLDNAFQFASFFNALVQTLFFVPQLKVHCENHLCNQELCAMCELNFLFRMLEEPKARFCNASNLIRAIRLMPNALDYGFLSENPQVCPLSALHKYLIPKLHKEYTSNMQPATPNQPEPPSRTPTINNLYGYNVRTTTLCLRCNTQTSKEAISYHVDFVYPPSSEKGLGRLSFATLLRDSLMFEINTVSWCSKCAASTQAIQTKTPLNLPNILAINLCSMKNNDGQEFWQAKKEELRTGSSWIPFKMKATLAGEKLTLQEFGEKIGDDTHDLYELSAVLSHIHEEATHYISHVNDAMYPILFTVDLDEKVPKVDVINPVTEQVFHIDTCLSKANPPKISSEQLPNKGDIVAIDAEFVANELVEIEKTADGKPLIKKLGRISVARVSVIDGKNEGLKIIDDYIVKREPVEDYLTRYSGIVEGDLDAEVTTHPLYTLKSSYLKLKHLVDRGVIFIGHGLDKDFKILDMVVPPSQVIDTVELFLKAKSRKISLRFLAAYLLNIDIQSETHCSLEDARTALALYRIYLQLVEKGEFDSTLEKIYEYGHANNWQPMLITPEAQPPTPISQS